MQSNNRQPVKSKAFRVNRASCSWLGSMKSIMKTYSALLALMLVGCVNVDPESGKTIPRGGQRYTFATVERHAEQLKEGMTKLDVMLLLGSPAETSDDGDVWMYVPERAAVLVPTRGLRLVFKNNLLESHEPTAIILGQQL